MTHEKRLGFVNTTSKDDTISCRIIDVELAKQIKEHCKLTNRNVSRFVEDCVRKCLENAYEEYLLTLPKEELIKMITEKKGE